MYIKYDEMDEKQIYTTVCKHNCCMFFLYLCIKYDTFLPSPVFINISLVERFLDNCGHKIISSAASSETMVFKNIIYIKLCTLLKIAQLSLSILPDEILPKIINTMYYRCYFFAGSIVEVYLN